MPNKHELGYGEQHPVITRAEVYLNALTEKNFARIEKELRAGMQESVRECYLLWVPFKAVTKGTPITPDNLMYLCWYIKEILG